MSREQPATAGTDGASKDAPVARSSAARERGAAEAEATPVATELASELERERVLRQAAEERVERVSALLAREREQRLEAQRDARALGAQLGSAHAEVLVRRRRRGIRRVPLLRRLGRHGRGQQG